MDETKHIDWPHPPVLDDLPDFHDMKTFAIMHIRLGRIVTQNSVDHDNFLPTITNIHYSQSSEIVGQITAYLSLNQPFGRYQALVCVGPGGIKIKENAPTNKVKTPSIRNKYLQPACPPTPRSRRIPVARKAPMICDM